MADNPTPETESPKITEESNSASADSNEEEALHTFKFPSHQNHLLTLAKMCKENKDYTDCVIQCDGEKLRAHRLVLGAASPFLKLVFGDVPPSLQEATVMVPGVKSKVVKALLDFLYTGEMTIDRSETADLQLLIDTLQIDPDLVSVDDDDEEEEEEKRDEEEAGGGEEETEKAEDVPEKVGEEKQSHKEEESNRKRKAEDEEGEASSKKVRDS